MKVKDLHFAFSVFHKTSRTAWTFQTDPSLGEIITCLGYRVNVDSSIKDHKISTLLLNFEVPSPCCRLSHIVGFSGLILLRYTPPKPDTKRPYSDTLQSTPDPTRSLS